MRLTAYLSSRQGLQKWWPQGVDSGSTSTPLHRVHVNSRSARSCSDACAGMDKYVLQADDRHSRHSNVGCEGFLIMVCGRMRPTWCCWRMFHLTRVPLSTQILSSPMAACFL